MKNNNVSDAQVVAPADLQSYIEKNSDFKKTFNAKKILIGSLLIVAGAVIAYFSEAGSMDKDTSFAVSAVSLILAIWGLIVVLFSRNRWVYVPTGVTMQKVTLNYNNECKSSVMTILKDGSTKKMPTATAHGVVQLDALKAVDGSVVCLQVSECQDFNYEALFEPMIFVGEKATDICEYLVHNSKH